MTILELLEAQGAEPFPYQTDHTQVTSTPCGQRWKSARLLWQMIWGQSTQECTNMSHTGSQDGRGLGPDDP